MAYSRCASATGMRCIQRIVLKGRRLPVADHGAINTVEKPCDPLPLNGARGGTRTPIQVSGLDPKSSASTNFATLANNQKK